MSDHLRDEIDPDVARLLQISHATDSARVTEMTPADARAWATRTSPKPRQPWTVPLVEDRRIPSTGGTLGVRLYHPAPGATRPLIVYFHGGGWVLGTVERADPIARRLCVETDAAVVSVEYRLAPEHPFPAGPQDAIDATAHCLDHAREFGGDPRRVAVAGDSAGGHLAAVAALGVRDRPGPSLALQYLIYPIIDDDPTYQSMRSNGSGRLLERDGITWFWNHFCPDPADRSDWRAVPLRAPTLAGLPTCVMTLAAHDPLLGEGLAYGRRLEDVGVRTTIRIARDLVHGYVAFESASERCHERIGEDHRIVAALLHPDGRSQAGPES